MAFEAERLIVVGEPNWPPLELVLTREECTEFMYMGRAGDIELYKHRITRRYLNISVDGQRCYRYFEGQYAEVTRFEAIDRVRS